MKRKIRYFIDLDKGFTPSTTISASPKSEYGKSERRDLEEKEKVLKEYEEQIFQLFSMVGKKKNEVEIRRDRVVHKEKLRNCRGEAVGNQIKELGNKYAGIQVGSAEIQKLERRTVMSEMKGKVLTEEIEKIADLLEAEKTLEKEREKKISEYSRALLKSYTDIHKLKITLQNVTESRMETQDFLENTKRALIKLHSTQKAPSTDCLKSLQLQDLIKKTQTKMRKIQSFQSDLQITKKSTEELVQSIPVLNKQYENLVAQIKNKIIALETLAEKVETHYILFKMRTENLSKGSTHIFSKSKEILICLKSLNHRIAEIDVESEKSVLRNNNLQQRIAAYKENREKQEKLRYFRAKFHQSAN